MREAVTRSAEATAAGLTLLLLAVGIIGTVALDGANASNSVLAVFAGLIVSGIGLELYTRGIGGMATRHEPPWFVACVVLGSPAVLLHAVTRRTGRLAPEPGSLAGLLVPVILVVFIWSVGTG
jgi:hypothetical protein